MFSGVRVLVVEDEPLIALELEDMLTELGCSVAGRAARLAPAVRLAADLEFDVAVLDVNLGEARVTPAAEVIAGRGIPIVFTTGYGETQREAFRATKAGCVVVNKPYDTATLAKALLHLLGEA